MSYSSTRICLSFYLDRLYEHEFIHRNKKIIRHLMIPIIANSYVKSMSMDIYRALFWAPKTVEVLTLSCCFHRLERGTQRREAISMKSRANDKTGPIVMGVTHKTVHVSLTTHALSPSLSFSAVHWNRRTCRHVTESRFHLHVRSRLSIRSNHERGFGFGQKNKFLLVRHQLLTVY